jgi:leader peptidase (prepilin peptidase)/N-methyltransferase
MIIFLSIIFFSLGLIIGSFLNVVIIRLNTERSLGGRSGCMTCGHPLSWYELIPLLSFLFLKGRCLECKNKISLQYPIVELVTGIIFAGLFLKFQNVFFLDTLVFSFTYAYYAVVFSLLVVVSIYDIRHKIIPDTLSFVLGLLAFIGLFFLNSNSFLNFSPHLPSLLEFFSGLIIAAPFAFFWLISRGTWMGLGDAKLAIGLGWLLGISRATSGIVLAFWIGAIVGISLVIFSKNHGMKSEIPFAPYLVLGMLLAFLFELHLF